MIASVADDLNLHYLPDILSPQTHHFSADEKPIRSISWNQDGSLLGVVSGTGCPKIFGFSKRYRLHNNEKRITAPITCATFQNTALGMAAATEQGKIFIHDMVLNNVKHLSELYFRNTTCINRLQFNKDDSLLAAVLAGDCVDVYARSSISPPITFITIDRAVSSITFHLTKSASFAVGGSEGLLKVWDIETGLVSTNRRIHKGSITCMGYSRLFPNVLITGGTDGILKLWSEHSRQPTQIKIRKSITALDFSSCGNYFALGTADGCIAVYDIRENKHMFSMKGNNSKIPINHLLYQKESPVCSSDVVSFYSTFT